MTDLELVALVRSRLASMSDAERLHLLELILDGYCTKCGSTEAPGRWCQCDNDE